MLAGSTGASPQRLELARADARRRAACGRRLVSRLGWALALAVLALGSPVLAAAQLAEADRAFDAGALAPAARAYEDAIRAGGLEPADLVRASVRLAALSSLGGETGAFERHVALALAVDPEAAPPSLLDPDWSARFEALRAARGGARLRVVLEVSDPDAPLGVDVRDAPEGLVRTVVLTGQSAWSRSLPFDGVRLEVDPPAAARPVEAAALDQHGNVLARAGVARGPALAVGPATTLALPATRVAVAEVAEPAPAETPLIESPWLWVIVGVVAIGIGVVVGVSASGERYVLDAPVVR